MGRPVNIRAQEIGNQTEATWWVGIPRSVLSRRREPLTKTNAPRPHLSTTSGRLLGRRCRRSSGTGGTGGFGGESPQRHGAGYGCPVNQARLFPVAQHGTTSDDYWTPTWLFDQLGVQFDLDVACPPGGAPWVPARAYYTQADDGLTAPWHGTVWMNPPFSSPAPWAWRFLEHGNGIALLPIGKSRWVQAVWDSDATLVYLPPNLKFQQGTIFIPTMLVALGDDMKQAVTKVGRAR